MGTSQAFLFTITLKIIKMNPLQGFPQGVRFIIRGPHTGTVIVVIGTGHVCGVGEPVSFIIRHYWPDAVLVELDVKRYEAASGKGSMEKDSSRKLPWIYRSTARYQSKMAGEYGSEVGGELLAAVNAGRMLGAEVLFIDSDAELTLAEAWEEMSLAERSRYALSMFRDRILGRRKVEETQKEFSENEAEYMAAMRRRYPVLVRKLIDERDAAMADQIMKAAERHDRMVVVVGDAHVEGICARLSSEMKKIRLKDLLDREALHHIKDEVWGGQAAEGGGNP
jgi:pheromone shutdown protein TraB